MILAEPFECFWAIYGLLGAASIVVRERRQQVGLSGDLPSIGPGSFGVYLWAALIAAGAALMATGLAWAGIRPLDRRPRALEATGLFVFSVPLAQQTILAVQHLTPGPVWIYQIFNIAVLSAIVLASLIRIVGIASPAGVMAVSRVSRIRLVRRQLTEMSKPTRTDGGNADER